MAQTLSLSSLTGTASQNGGISWPAPSRRSKTQNQIVEGRHIWNFSVQIPSVNLKGNPNLLRRRDTRVGAGWLFKGLGGGGGGDQSLDASSEQSETANEDILMFFFQLDLATRVQVCLAFGLYI